MDNAKRQPLSVMIALQSKKLKGDKPAADDGYDHGSEDGGDEPDESGGKYDDEGMIHASEDVIDAMKNRDAKALNVALCHWAEMHAAHGDDEPDADDQG